MSSTVVLCSGQWLTESLTFLKIAFARGTVSTQLKESTIPPESTAVLDFRTETHSTEGNTDEKVNSVGHYAV